MPIEINEKEYVRLFNEDIGNKTSWKFKSNLYVNSFINDIFEENKFFYAIIFDNKYDILKNNSNTQFLDDLRKYFDHYYSVSFKQSVSHIEHPETITGIMDFPNIEWNTISQIITKLPGGWKIFIINPILMRYDKSIGLFLTPKYADDIFIEECNSFIQLKTGYPLFLEYSNKETVPEILFDKPELTLESYVEEMKKYGNKGLDKLLDFWVNNDCISVSSFEYSFKDYKENLPFSVWHDIDLKEIKSFNPFELVHEETGEILGPFHKFILDKSFKLADTNNGVLQLNDSQIDDLIEGNYDFKLIQ